jgi:3-hydroxyacyl-CoA dehydrogenase
MGLEVVAAFPGLMEAQIASGALRAAGFDVLLFDENFGCMLPTDLIGGFRLVVPEEQLGAARSFLAAVAPDTARS